MLKKQDFITSPCKLICALVSLIAPTGYADDLRVAVAANFYAPAQALAENFGSDVQVIKGASGKLFAQITHGAPFDVFLSADQVIPASLIENEQALAQSKITYAEGRLVLWSAQGLDAPQLRKRLSENNFNKLAIANARLAPYGVAAEQALTYMQLFEQSASKLVRGENIAQTFQYVHAGAADFGLVALSQMKPSQAVSHAPKQDYWLIPSDYHQPILQDGVVLKRAENNQRAMAFMRFLTGREARHIIERFGYSVPTKASEETTQLKQHIEAKG